MRIVVISDSHGKSSTVMDIIEEQNTARNIFFLGDVVGDIEDSMLLYPDRNYFVIKGNCDFDIGRGYEIAEIDGKRILYTHGHRFSVKYGLGVLKELAKETGASVVLYGHTHIADILYEDGIYFVNPGSASRPREGHPSYAVIDIDGNNILPAILKI